MPWATLPSREDDLLGYEFGDKETRMQLELMNDLQKVGISKYLDLPQLVVVGDQSTGKSSVLQAVTEIPFAIDDRMCTRFATEIHLRRTPDKEASVEISIIPSPDEPLNRQKALLSWKPLGFKSDTKLTKSTMQDIFEQAESTIFGTPITRSPRTANPGEKNQRKEYASPWEILAKQNHNLTDGFSSESSVNLFDPKAPVTDFSFDAKSAPKQFTFNSVAHPSGLFQHLNSTPTGQTQSSRLSSSVLRITRCGPDETNFAIVDVPGLVRGNETNAEHRTAKYLVQKYLANPRSIVVVVIDVVDLERQEIFQMLNNLPNEESRVIGVINKCDTKQKKSHDWVFDLIRNASHAQSKRYLKEGWYGLRNRQASEQDDSDEVRDQKEQDFFAGEEWNKLDSSKLGRHQLKQALVRMLNRHVKSSISTLLSEIQGKLVICKEELSKLGESRNTNQSQFLSMNRIAITYTSKVHSGLQGHYNDLQDPQTFIKRHILEELDTFREELVLSGPYQSFRTSSEDGSFFGQLDQSKWISESKKLPTYKWIQDEIHNYRANSDRRKANPEVESKLWREQTAEWSNIASSALGVIQAKVESINTALFKEACPEENVRIRLMNWLQEDFAKAFVEAEKELGRLLVDEREAPMFSLQPLKNVTEARFREKRLQKIAEKARGENPERSSLTVLIGSIIYGDPELACILDTHDSLAAYYEIALGRFIDNFAMQVVERHLLGPAGPLRLFNSEYVSNKLYGPENAELLNAIACEDPGTSRRRHEMEVERASLEESKRRLQQFRIS